MATSSKYDTAIAILNKLSVAEPTNLDFILYRARVQTWAKKFKPAEKDALSVLNKRPNDREVLLLISDIYLWSQQWGNLHLLTKIALNNSPKSLTAQEALADSILFIKKYVNGLIEQERYHTASKALVPIKTQLTALWDFVQVKKMTHTLFINETYYKFSAGQKDWSVTHLEYAQKLPKMTVIGSLNRAYRFGKSGNQYMLQLYPKISNRAYLWLLGSKADGRTHPNLVYGGSFFLYPHKHLEIEMGIRFFRVNDVEKATILRGGGAYQNGFTRMGYNIAEVRGISARGYTHTAYFQKYFKKDDSFWKVSLGTGSNSNNLLLPQYDNFIINSFSMNISALYVFNHHWRVLGGISFETSKSQLNSFGQARGIFDVGLAYKF